MRKVSEPGSSLFSRYFHGVVQQHIEKGDSLRGVAARAGVDASLISKFIHGSRVPEPGTMRDIGERLGLPEETVDDLIFLAELTRVPDWVRFMIDLQLGDIEEFLEALQDAPIPELAPQRNPADENGNIPIDLCGQQLIARGAVRNLRRWFPDNEDHLGLFKGLGTTAKRVTETVGPPPIDTKKRQAALIAELATLSGVRPHLIGAYVQGITSFIEASKGAHQC